MNIQTNSAAPSGAVPVVVSISAISSRYLAHRVGVAHFNVMTCVNSAAERLGRLDLVETRTGMASNAQAQTYAMVGAEIVAEMARGAAMAGRHETAQVYRDVFAEMAAGEVLRIDRATLPSGVAVPPTNPSNAEQREQKRARMRALAGIPPEVSSLRGRAGLDHRAVANFIGSQTAHTLRSVARLIARRPELFGEAILPTLIEYVAGSGGAERNTPGYFLTVEAIDALADQFGLCTNERGQAKTALLRELAGHLRAAVAGPARAAAE